MLHKLTAFSAAQMLIAWEKEHARLPEISECKSTNGLPHFTTIYKLYPDIVSFSAIVQRLKDSFSSGSFPDTKNSGCMRCGKKITSKQKNIRHCPTCRGRMFSSTDIDLDTGVPRNIVKGLDRILSIDDDDFYLGET